MAISSCQDRVSSKPPHHSSSDPNSTAEANSKPPSTQLVDYLVPISVLLKPQQASTDETTGSGSSPNAQTNKNQPKVESLAWSIIETSSARVIAAKLVRIEPSEAARNESLPKSARVVASLAEAIAQLEQSLPPESKQRCRLLACGPLALRQYLFPAAKRAQCELSDLFDSYVDLSREFESRFGRLHSNGSININNNNHSQPAGLCGSSSSNQAPNSDRACSHQQVRSKLARMLADAGRGHLLASSATAAAHQSHHSMHLAIGAVLRRLAEMFEYLHQDPIDRCCCCCVTHSASGEPLASLLAAADDSDEDSSNLNLNPNSGSNPNSNGSHETQEERRRRRSKSSAADELNAALVGAISAIAVRMLGNSNAGRLSNQGTISRIKRRVEVGLCDANPIDAEHRVVRARGLPWQATEQDIADFFTGLNISKGGVALCLSRQGRRNGEALIQFDSREERNLALGRHKHFMGPRYIEVYRASADDFMSVATGYNDAVRTFLSKDAQAIVRMRGLPFSCTAKQVVDFFASQDDNKKIEATQTAKTHSNSINNNNESSSHRPTANKTSDSKNVTCDRSKVNLSVKVLAGEDGVLFVKNHEDKPTGDAFVLFSSDADANLALKRHHQNIGTRYVELFRSTISEVQQVLSTCTEAQVQQPCTVSSKASLAPLLTSQSDNDVVNSLAQECWPSCAASAGSATSAGSCERPTNTTYALVAQQSSTKATCAGKQAPRADTSLINQQVSSSSSLSTSIVADANYESETSGCGSSECTDPVPNNCTLATSGLDNSSNSGNNTSDASSSRSSSDTSGLMEIEDDAKSSIVASDAITRSSPDDGSISEAASLGAAKQTPGASPTPPSMSPKNAKALDHHSHSTSGPMERGFNRQAHKYHNGQSYAWRQQQQQQQHHHHHHHNNNNHHQQHHQHHHHQQQQPQWQSPMDPSVGYPTSISGPQMCLMQPHYATTLPNGTMAHHQSAPVSHWVAASGQMMTQGAAQQPYYYAMAPAEATYQHLYASPPPAHSSLYQTEAPAEKSTAPVDCGEMATDTSTSPATSSAQACSTTTATTTAPPATSVQSGAQPEDMIQATAQMAPVQMCQMDACYYSPPNQQQLFHHYPHHAPTNYYHQLAAYSSHEPLPPHPLAGQMQQHSTSRYNNNYHHPRHTQYQLQTALSTMPTSTTTTTAPSSSSPPSNPPMTSRRDCIRLRGLPFEAQVDDIVRFLGSHSSHILYQGVHMVYSPTGHPTGEAVVQMTSCNDATNVAQLTHKRVMILGKKKRYIEVIPSSIDDMRSSLGPGLASLLHGVANGSGGPLPVQNYAPYPTQYYSNLSSAASEDAPTSSSSSLSSSKAAVDPPSTSASDPSTDPSGFQADEHVVAATIAPQEIVAQ